VLIRRNTRIAKRTKQDGVKFVAEHFDGVGWQANALAQILVGSPVEIDEFHGPLCR